MSAFPLHRLALLAALSFTLVAGAAETDTGKILQVGAKRTVRSLSVAAAQAKSGDTVEVDPGEYVGDVAVWTQDNLTIRAVGGRAHLIAAGASAESKAIWVIRGGTVTVENMDFSGTKVPGRNGAGIRFEKGRLRVRHCGFFDNENGILTANDKTAELEIEGSEFGNNGFGDGQSHNLYVGSIRRLSVSSSYFHHARSGHLLKSRAMENLIVHNRLTDEPGGRASYELELPNGGLAYVIGNVIEQSSQTENSTMVSFGAEGYAWPVNELYLVNNTLADDRPSPGKFLAVKPGIQRLVAVNNLLVGKGSLDPSAPQGRIETLKHFLGAGKTDANALFENNLNVDWGEFTQASRLDYRLLPTSPLIGKALPPGEAHGISLAPKSEYVHPRALRPVTGKLSPGALQTPGDQGDGGRR